MPHFLIKGKEHDDQLHKGRGDIDMFFCKPSSLQRTDLENMIDTTRKMLVQFEMDIRDFFVTTRANEKVYKVLEKTRCVFVKGNPGDGKTTIAKHILFTLMKEKQVLPLQMLSLKKFYEMVPSSSRLVIFLDNMFGERSVSKEEIQYFNAQKDLIKTILSENNDGNGNFFIATLRNDIYRECEGTILDINVFEDAIVDLSDTENRINREEFENFVSKYKLHDSIVSDDEVLNSRNLFSTIGIPQCIKISEKIAQRKENICDVLKNPFEHLQKEIMLRIQDKEHKTAVLIYILLCGGSVKDEKMKNPRKDREKKKKALRIMELKENVSSLSKFQDSVRFYEGSYIYHDDMDNEYRFTHSSIQESFFLYLCHYYPEDILSTCDPSLFLSLTTTTTTEISPDLFPVLIERIIVIFKEKKVSEYRCISYMTLWSEVKFTKEIKQNKECIKIMKNNVDENGDSMLVHFSGAGHSHWVAYLLSCSSENQRYTSLNRACMYNRICIVDLILEANVICDLKTCFYAVQSGNSEILFRFTDNVDLNQIEFSNHPRWSSFRGSLLQEICFFGQNQLIEPILRRYPIVRDVKNEQGGNALHFVAFAGQKDSFQMLVNSGSDPYSRSHLGTTVLHYACQNGKLNMVKYICDTYPKLLTKSFDDYEGHSSLHWAAQSGNIELYQYLLEKDINVSFRNGFPSPLNMACENEQIQMCKYLLKNNPELLKSIDKDGKTALHAAASGGNIDIFKHLTDKGFDIRNTTNIGKTVLHQCCMNGRLEMCKYLIKHYPDLMNVIDNNGYTVLHDAAKTDNVELFYYLSSVCKDLNNLTKKGKSVLHISCLWGNFEMCKYLADAYPKLVEVIDNDGESVLHDAAWGGNIDVLKLLIDKGVGIKSTTSIGKTVLHQSCMN
ncbi:serine/threonine-protein phosphatase 6 regulatory ankyrin repeat subunit A-like, partial [Saccostrea cucullata]|uniref:serine/threonine-protein phosphatase 6 regulatory ankyrin repeat subunit A-like n=1 Tax=Saccostrea cuccullata TaxID=36930 RepID=UPI002ED1B540